MAVVLVYSDKSNLARELVTAGRSLGYEVQAVAVNDNDLAQSLNSCGIKVLNIENSSLNMADTAALASALKQAADQAGAALVLLSSNRRLKEAAGRLAQMRGGVCLTDISSLTVNDSQLIASRNALGGATVATYGVDPQNAVIAITAKAFDGAAEAAGGSIEPLTINIKPMVKLLETRPKAGDSVKIDAADVLVAVGQGLNSQEDLGMIEELAKALGGEVGCSKPVATDKKWLSEDRIIGLSGKICKPSLAVVLGISGQVQFAVGIRDAKTVVAVNTDENASIATQADYFLVGDIHEVVPALTKALS
ncbi:MAG: electron transfer flavoprotein subunit alpha/FixB family protein [Methylocystaceae bacterium]